MGGDLKTCPVCGYSLAGLNPHVAAKCPECGEAVPWGRAVLRRVPRGVWLAALLLTAAGQILPAWAVLKADLRGDMPGGALGALLWMTVSPVLSVPATVAAVYLLVRFGPRRRFTAGLWLRIFAAGSVVAVGLTVVVFVLCTAVLIVV